MDMATYPAKSVEVLQAPHSKFQCSLVYRTPIYSLGVHTSTLINIISDLLLFAELQTQHKAKEEKKIGEWAV